MCPESSAILCIRSTNFKRDSLKTKKRCGPEKHTFAVLGITCIKDNEAVCPGKARIRCIKDSLYYKSVGIGVVQTRSGGFERVRGGVP